MGKATLVVKYVFSNFGPLIVFYFSNHFWGLKIAILVSLIFSIGELCFKLAKKAEITPFFKFSAAVTLVFGCMDLFLKGPFFFRYEPAFSNVITGAFFSLSLRDGSSLIQEAAKQRMRDKPITPDHVWYFRMLTLIWVAYFMIKAAFYAWVGSRYSIDRAMAIRAIVGNSTLYLLMAISMFGSKPIFAMLRKLKLLPSSNTPVVPAS